MLVHYTVSKCWMLSAVASLHPKHCTFPLAELPHITHKLLALYHSTDGSSSSSWRCQSCSQHILAFLPSACMHLLSRSCCCLKYLLPKSEAVL